MAPNYHLLAIISLSFVSFLFLLIVFSRIGLQNLSKALVINNGVLLLNIKHVFGILVFGLLNYIAFPQYQFLLKYIEIPSLKTFLLIIFSSAASVIIANKAFKKYKEEYEPLSTVDFSEAWQYFSLRFLYLLAYEFFFRGILFFMALEFTGLLGAITINLVLYGIAHLFDGKKEIIGTIPMGIILCLFAYYTNSIWPAFLIHLSLSAVYEISLFHFSTQPIQEP